MILHITFLKYPLGVNGPQGPEGGRQPPFCLRVRR